jgi:hypothetical protein
MRNHLVLTAAAAIAFAGPALAQPPATSGGVTVAIGPALQQKARDLGPRELMDISADLRRAAEDAVAHAGPAGPVHVDLVIEDAVPNHPTFDQLSRTVGLSMRSFGVGGARVSGVVTYADGSRRPIREQYYETDIREERGVSTWYDAERAFEQVAYDIRRGKLPAAYAGPGPSGGGHFGYPYNDR